MNILPKNFIFSPLGIKIVKKFPPNFHFQEWKSVQICTFFGKNCQDIHFFGKNLTKIAYLWEKIALFGPKIVKISIFWRKNYKNLHFLGYKLQKFANLGVKFDKNREIGTFLG